MASGANPFFGTLVRLDALREQRDPASHGIDYALELQIAARTGEIAPAPAGGASASTGALARAWSWLHALHFVGHRP
jgi:hypothetical protein